jgi:hypothetical protein
MCGRGDRWGGEVKDGHGRLVEVVEYGIDGSEESVRAGEVEDVVWSEGV